LPPSSNLNAGPRRRLLVFHRRFSGASSAAAGLPACTARRLSASAASLPNAPLHRTLSNATVCQAR